MGALPSQKYDEILKEFCEYVKQKEIRIGVYKKTDDRVIDMFLEEKDKGKTFHEFEPIKTDPAIFNRLNKSRKK